MRLGRDTQSRDHLPVGTALVTATTSMRVNLAAFSAITVRDGGVVLLANDGTVSVNLAQGASTFDRLDLIYAKQSDSSTTVTTPDSGDTPVIGVISSMAGPSPAVPATPVGGIALATVRVPAFASSTSGAGVVITQVYPYTTGAGGTVPVRDQTEMNAWTPSDGSTTFRLSDGTFWVRVGGAWVSPWRALDAWKTRMSTGFDNSNDPSLINGRYKFILQGDGNVVLYSNNTAIWNTNTSGG